MVSKLKSYFFVDLSWVAEKADFWQSAYEAQLQHIKIDQLLPENEIRNIWKLKSLRRSSLFWLQLIASLINDSKDKNIYSWAEHPLFYYARNEYNKKYNSAVNKNRSEIYRVITGNTWLDRNTVSQWGEKRDLKTKFGEKMPNLGCSSINIIGDYIVKVKVGSNLMNKVKEVYRNSDITQLVDVDQIEEMVSLNDQVSIELIADAKKAKDLKEKIIRIFMP